MGTLSEEIISHKLGRNVSAGDIVVVDVDFVLSHDTTTPLAIKSLEAMGKGVFDPKRAVVVFDHIIPAPSIKAATLQRDVRNFVKSENIENFHQEGVCHQIMVEKNYAIPGNVIVGADSHSCTHGAIGCFSTGMGSTDISVAYATGKTWLKIPETIELKANGVFPQGVYAKDLILDMVGTVGADGATYRAVEYTGSTIANMSIDERLTLTSMAVEMGAKAGLVAPDEKTMQYTGNKGTPLQPIEPKYLKTIEFDVDNLVPKIAVPHRVDNVYDLSKYEEMHVDQVFVGTCTNGRLSDIEIVAGILDGKKIHRDTRLVVVPASLSIFRESYRLGYIEKIQNAGGIVTNPGCGPCIGRHQGVLAPDEVALTTMNRNFKGRMGSPDAEIYLGSPATAAYTALRGSVTNPMEVMN